MDEWAGLFKHVEEEVQASITKKAEATADFLRKEVNTLVLNKQDDKDSESQAMISKTTSDTQRNNNKQSSRGMRKLSRRRYRGRTSRNRNRDGPSSGGQSVKASRTPSNGKKMIRWKRKRLGHKARRA